MLDDLVEKRIAAARARGDFDNLEGTGEIVDLNDDAHVPEEWRLAFRVLRNAGYAPEEVSLRKQIAEIEAQLAGEPEADRERLRKLAALRIHLSLSRGARETPLSVEHRYQSQVLDKIGARRR